MPDYHPHKPQFSFEAKLERANQHLQSLKAAIQEWTASHPYTVIQDIDPQTGDNIVYFDRIDAPPESIRLLIGDCLFNFRSALDHLVQELALKNRGSLTEEESIEMAFPIFKFEAGFLKRGAGRIRHIDPKARAVIDGLQPYHAGSAAELQWLWILEKLHNIDKHRRILFTLAINPGETLSIPPGSQVQLQITQITVIKTPFSVPVRILENRVECLRYRCIKLEDGTRQIAKVRWSISGTSAMARYP
jgi:hypothetical protein